MKPVTRRSFLASAALLGAAATMKGALAKEAKMADFLFVQNAKSMRYDKASGTLTLVDVSPVTLFFSDRPERIAGNMPTDHFIPFWGEGKDSFAKDNPNANLSILEKDKAFSDVVVELSRPSLKGGNLTYSVKIIDGVIPAKGGPVSLFIDVIGMPLTPLSYAGVARRTAYRRAVYLR